MYKILIVEDNQGIAESVAAQAKKWNFEVECVTDFRAVLDAFVSFEPHLVLLDITLPFLQRILLVRRNSKNFKGSGNFYFVSIG